MYGVVIYAGTSFFFYETFKHFWVSQQQEQRRKDAHSVSRDEGERDDGDKGSRRGLDGGPNVYQRLISGALAGLFGQTSSYPLDIVRRRMQTARQMGVPHHRYATILGTLWVVYQKEGIVRGWYKGLSMNFIKGPIATSISFTTFDYFQLGLRKLLIVLLNDNGTGTGR